MTDNNRGEEVRIFPEVCHSLPNQPYPVSRMFPYRPEKVLNKDFCGEAPPRGSTPYPFVYHFSQKRYPFRTYLVYNLFTVCKIWTNHKTRTFSPLFHCHKMHPLALSGLLLTEIPTLTSEIPTLWYTYSLQKVPLSGGAFAYSPIIGRTPTVSMISWSSGRRWWAPGSSYRFCQRQNRGKRLCWNRIIWQKLKRCYMKCHYLLFIFC